MKKLKTAGSRETGGPAVFRLYCLDDFLLQPAPLAPVNVQRHISAVLPHFYEVMETDAA